MKYLWISFGGALGAVSRYALSVWIYERLGTQFPYGTFVVNMTGCFLIGLISTFLESRTGIPLAWRYALPIGFIGAYTTFSAFEYETLTTAQAGQTMLALLNIALSVVLGYLAVWLGVVAAKLLA